MSTIVLDAQLRAKLNGLNEPMEVRDESGKVVGRFLPETRYRQLLAKGGDIPFSKEEIAELRKAKGGCSLDEFWKKMGVR
jgi:hypothetical protein